MSVHTGICKHGTDKDEVTQEERPEYFKFVNSAHTSEKQLQRSGNGQSLHWVTRMLGHIPFYIPCRVKTG